jgi:hypothetical protein
MSVNRKLELSCPKGHGTYGADSPDEECPACADGVPEWDGNLNRTPKGVNMKSHTAKLVIIDGCGDELLDRVLATVNYELSGDGTVLVHTDDLNQTNDTLGLVEKIQEHLDSKDSCTTSKHYEGQILLRR